MKKPSGFEKFHKSSTKKGAALKEHFRQEKKQVTKERKEFFEAKRQEKATRNPRTGGGPVRNERFEKEPRREPARPSKMRVDKPVGGSKPARPANTEGRSPYQSKAGADRKPFTKRDDLPGRPARDYKPAREYNKPQRPESGQKPVFVKKQGEGERPPANRAGSDRGPLRERAPKKEYRSTSDRPAPRESGGPSRERAPKKEFGPSRERGPKKEYGPARERTTRPERPARPEPMGGRFKKEDDGRGSKTVHKAPTEQMPLNKYLAHGGVCGRREAADIVRGGKVKVNGELITEPGHKVQPNDEVRVAGKIIFPVRNRVYILLNKPKDYLTTTDDPEGRKTVLDLIQDATTERVYPVGRLDRNTSGVLLLTNDGELAQKLTHPSNEIKKVYAVTLDKPLTRAHFDTILKGIQLEDGMAHVDVLAYTDNADKTQVGVEIHSGRNRIVRRIFEHLGYDVKALDRVTFAGLTKKNVNRGKWRLLNEKEVRDLKFFKKGR